MNVLSYMMVLCKAETASVQSPCSHQGCAEESPNFTGQGAGRESKGSSPGMTAQAGYHRECNRKQTAPGNRSKGETGV